MFGLHPSERWDTHGRGTHTPAHLRRHHTRAQPLTRTQVRRLCARFEHARCASDVGGRMCGRVRLCMRASVAQRLTEKRLSAAFRSLPVEGACGRASVCDGGPSLRHTHTVAYIHHAYILAHTHAHPYLHARTHTHTHTHTHTRRHTKTHAHTHTHTNKQTYKHHKAKQYAH